MAALVSESVARWVVSRVRSAEDCIQAARYLNQKRADQASRAALAELLGTAIPWRDVTGVEAQRLLRTLGGSTSPTADAHLSRIALQDRTPEGFARALHGLKGMREASESKRFGGEVAARVREQAVELAASGELTPELLLSTFLVLRGYRVTALLRCLPSLMQTWEVEGGVVAGVVANLGFALARLVIRDGEVAAGGPLVAPYVALARGALRRGGILTPQEVARVACYVKVAGGGAGGASAALVAELVAYCETPPILRRIQAAPLDVVDALLRYGVASEAICDAVVAPALARAAPDADAAARPIGVVLSLLEHTTGDAAAIAAGVPSEKHGPALDEHLRDVAGLLSVARGLWWPDRPPARTGDPVAAQLHPLATCPALVRRRRGVDRRVADCFPAAAHPRAGRLGIADHTGGRGLEVVPSINAPPPASPRAAKGNEAAKAAAAVPPQQRSLAAAQRAALERRAAGEVQEVARLQEEALWRARTGTPSGEDARQQDQQQQRWEECIHAAALLAQKHLADAAAELLVEAAYHEPAAALPTDAAAAARLVAAAARSLAVSLPDAVVAHCLLRVDMAALPGSPLGYIADLLWTTHDLDARCPTTAVSFLEVFAAAFEAAAGGAPGLPEAAFAWGEGEGRATCLPVFWKVDPRAQDFTAPPPAAALRILVAVQARGVEDVLPPPVARAVTRTAGHYGQFGHEREREALRPYHEDTYQLNALQTLMRVAPTHPAVQARADRAAEALARGNRLGFRESFIAFLWAGGSGGEAPAKHALRIGWVKGIGGGGGGAHDLALIGRVAFAATGRDRGWWGGVPYEPVLRGVVKSCTFPISCLGLDYLRWVLHAALFQADVPPPPPLTPPTALASLAALPPPPCAAADGGPPLTLLPRFLAAWGAARRPYAAAWGMAPDAACDVVAAAQALGVGEALPEAVRGALRASVSNVDRA